jgi:hypothetical protein
LPSSLAGGLPPFVPDGGGGDGPSLPDPGSVFGLIPVCIPAFSIAAAASPALAVASVRAFVTIAMICTPA